MCYETGEKTQKEFKPYKLGIIFLDAGTRIFEHSIGRPFLTKNLIFY